MFEEAQLYTPVTRSGEGEVIVHLSDDHPGAVDPEYRARRNALAALAMEWQPGTPLPPRPTPRRSTTCGGLCGELHGLHERLACSVYLEGKQRLGLPESRIPQLSEVNELLNPLTGFQYVPAAGLVPLLEFYGSLADGIFHSTQYVRHHSVPLYTPSPTCSTRSSGTGTVLPTTGSPGSTAGRGRGSTGADDRGVGIHLRVFWFSLEFGVVPKAARCAVYGAGLLSSYGEIQQVARGRPAAVEHRADGCADLRHHALPADPVLR